jgi:membrane associated rhomboid family serine protease
LKLRSKGPECFHADAAFFTTGNELVNRAVMAGSAASAVFRELKAHGTILGCLAAIMWATACTDFFLGGSLVRFGIVPRTETGLRGILFAPFLHANFAHLIANTVPFITLGWFVMLRRTSDFYWVSLVSMLVGGLGTWLIASGGTVHIGASGVIFGYLGYLISRGFFERSVLSVLASIAIAFVYGGLLWGVLPGKSGISWEGHLCGFIGGMIAARLIVRK